MSKTQGRTVESSVQGVFLITYRFVSENKTVPNFFNIFTVSTFQITEMEREFASRMSEAVANQKQEVSNEVVALKTSIDELNGVIAERNKVNFEGHDFFYKWGIYYVNGEHYNDYVLILSNLPSSAFSIRG